MASKNSESSKDTSSQKKDTSSSSSCSISSQAAAASAKNTNAKESSGATSLKKDSSFLPSLNKRDSSSQASSKKESASTPALKKESSQVFPSKKESSSQAPPSNKKEPLQAPPSKKEPAQGNIGGGNGGGNGGAPPPPSGDGAQSGVTSPTETSRAGNSVLKSGPLLIACKGGGPIAWTSWKKRWFILTRTSLVFFRSDPSAVPQKGAEVNLTLGGIDLNNSGSVEIKPDKKLLTVLFPDGRDGRAFTLKAETLEDLHDWKAALENALSLAPTSANTVGKNGILRNNEQPDAAVESALEQPAQPVQENKQMPGKSVVIGRPILLALEEVDGSPSFLEKALRFVEGPGVKTEGILRQAADVDDVMHRIKEYEQGKTEFVAGEDAHVIADCVKYVIRELPSSPVPASCCNALVEACRTERGGRLNAMRFAICETFPEPNRRLLQRILEMMQTVASFKAENRMSTSAVAACMAPLLLRPLLSGDCEIENDFDVGGDGSVQLLQAAAAANHAQAIVITLLEDYDSLFREGAASPGMYSNSEESEDASDDDESYEEGDEDDDDDYDEEDDVTHESEGYTEDDLDDGSGGSYSERGDSIGDDLDEDKGSRAISVSAFTEELDVPKVNPESPKSPKTLVRQRDFEISEIVSSKPDTNLEAVQAECEDVNTEKSSTRDLHGSNLDKSKTLGNGPGFVRKRNTVWGRAPAKKNLSMESIDFPLDNNDDEEDIQELEKAKLDLQNRVAEEIKGNSVLEARMEQRKMALIQSRVALKRDIESLKEQLRKERDKRKAMESGLDMYDEQTKAILEEIAQVEEDFINLKLRVDNLASKLPQQMDDSCDRAQESSNQKMNQDNEATASYLTTNSSGNDSFVEGSETGNDKKKQNKPPRQKQQQDGQPPASNLTGSASSKKSGSLFRDSIQGQQSTNSALSRLTTRLNFLKEKRTEIANELQNLDKGHGLGKMSDSKTEKGKRLDNSNQAELTDSSPVKYERFRNPENSAGMKMLDEGRKSKNQNPHILERGRSERHVSYNADNIDIGLADPPRYTQRTYSR